MNEKSFIECGSPLCNTHLENKAFEVPKSSSRIGISGKGRGCVCRRQISPISDYVHVCVCVSVCGWKMNSVCPIGAKMIVFITDVSSCYTSMKTDSSSGNCYNFNKEQLSLNITIPIPQ